MFQPATERQLSYISALQSRAGVPAVVPSPLSSREASALIEQLKSLAAVTPAAAPTSGQLVTEGIYRRGSDGAMFRVQTSMESSRRYARLLLPEGGWGYERGAIYTLKQEERLTLAQLEEWGISTGVCAICGRLLSTTESVARGIGPVCASRY